MSNTIDYYFSPISPFTYLGGPRLYDLASRLGVRVVHKPVKMGDIFAVSGGVPLPKRAPQRRAYRLVELRRISRRYGMPLTLEPAHFPTDDTLASRMIIAVERGGGDAGPLAQALLRAVWAEERDIADAATLAAIAEAQGYDAAALLAEARSEPVGEALEANTREAIDRGVFGAPTYVWKDELFWGQDRLDYLEEAIRAG